MRGRPSTTSASTWRGAAAPGRACACSTRDGRLLDEAWLAGDALLDWIREWRGDQSLLAIDAPLVVPPDSGVMRPAEVALHRRYGRFHAGPFPGGARSLAMRGRAERGSPAHALMDTLGQTTADPFATHAPHRAIEVFPAPTWIEVFGLSDRIAYKSLRGETRRAVLARLIGYLEALATMDPPLLPNPDHDLHRLLAAARTGRPGQGRGGPHRRTAVRLGRARLRPERRTGLVGAERRCDLAARATWWCRSSTPVSVRCPRPRAPPRPAASPEVAT